MTAGHRGINLILDAEVLAVEVYEWDLHLIFLAGFPTYVPGSAMSLVTTAPAPMTTSSQTVTGSIVALLPMETRLPILVDFQREASPPAGPPFGEGVIDEHHAVTNEAIVADGHQFANEAVALHLGALAHHDALLNFAEWSHEDPVRQRAFIEVAGFDDCHVFPSV